MRFMKKQIIVAMHKPYRLPSDSVYVPVQVGRALHDSIGVIQGDDTGENISRKNPNYCELTALYWAWKNLDFDYLGLVHYRRYFVIGKGKEKWNRIVSSTQWDDILSKWDVVLPKKREYWIETNYSQYAHAHHAQDLDQTRQILAERYPEYLAAFDAVMKQTNGHRFNMFVMKRELLDAYCNWIFDVLEQLEKRLDIRGYSTNDARVFGFVSERLLDVWLETNQIAYGELPVAFMEKQNWLKKGGAFLKRKFLKQKKKGVDK